MIKAGPNTITNSNSNSSNSNNTTNKTTTNSNKPLNGQSSSNKAETKTNLVNDPKLDEVTSEDENLTNYEKYINKRNKTLQTNCPLILSISSNTTGNGSGTGAGINTSTSGSGRPVQSTQVQFDSSKLNPETLGRVCKGLNLNTNGLSLKQINNKLDKFWVNEYKPDADFILAKSLLKVKYDMGLESKDFNSIFDSEDEFQYFGQSSELGQSDNDDSSECYNNNDTNSNNQRTKRTLPTDGRQGTRVKKRLHYYNIAEDPEPQLDEIYQNPLDYLTNFSNNRNLYEPEDSQEINDDENNDSVLDSKTPTNIDEKTPKSSNINSNNNNNNQVDNLREESNYMIEDDTQDHELEEFEHDNDDSQLSATVDTKALKNHQEAVAEDRDKDKDNKEESEDQEPLKEHETTETEPDEPVKAVKEPVDSDPKETEPEEERDFSPKSEKQEIKDDSLEDIKSPTDPEPVHEDRHKTPSPAPVEKPKELSPIPHDQSSPLPELTDPPTPGQQDVIPQEDGEAGEEAETEEEEEEEAKDTKPDYKSALIRDNDLDFTSDISDLTNPESP